MNHQWIILLFVGCAAAAPWPWSDPVPKREITDEEKREIRIREILTDPNAPAEAKIEAVNEENDLQLSFGDLKLTTEQEAEIKEGHSNLDKRSTSQLDKGFLWQRRTVPIVLHDGLVSEKVTLIRQAIEIFHSQSCVRFVDRTNEPYYLYFKNLVGCWSYVGFTNNPNGYQDISIGDGCGHLGVILHEIMHALGFWHEQSRPDRDSTVEILWENIVDSKKSNFDKLDESKATKMKTNYDEMSIMHYANYAFSKNGKKTIQDINNPSKALGQKDHLSNTDIAALDLLYSCNVTDGGWSPYTEYGPCGDICRKFRSRFCTNAQSSAACDPAYPDGVQREGKDCPDDECYKPVNGHWGAWSEWGKCDKECGVGKKNRTRKCDDPAPKYNGTNCASSSTESGDCQDKECGAGPCDCGFDDASHPMCGWVQDPDDNKDTHKDFIRGSSTPSGNTGPQNGDHTSGNGMFIYSETSDCIHTTGKFVRLLSTMFEATGSSGRCFTFWYYAYGATLGDFNVYLRTGAGETKIGGFTSTELRDQNLDKKWKKAQFHFTSVHQYKIVLESKCGLDYRADFAIDDTKFTDGACT